MKISKQDEYYEEEEQAKTPDTETEDEVDDPDEPGEEDEEDEDDEDDDEDDEDDEDEDESSEIKTIFGVDRKYVLLGLVVIIIIVVGTTIFRGCGKKEEPEEVSEDIVDDSEYFDMGYSDSMTYEDQYDTTGESQEQAPAENHTVDDILITDEMAKQLSSYGYTGDEIELAKEFGLTPDVLIENAKLRQVNSAKEVIKQLSNTGSIAYQNLANMTYLGQEYVQAPVDQTKIDSSKAKMSESEETIQCTYEKCPTYGAQLYLKCKIFNGVYVWYVVTPQRWVQLPETGSITLHVKYTLYGENIYVTYLEEVTDPNARVVQSDVTEQTSPFAEAEEGSIVQ